MGLSKPYTRDLMLYNFNSGLKAADLVHQIISAFGEDTLSERMERDCFAWFCTRDHDDEDRPRSGCPYRFYDERLRQLLEDYSQQTHVSLGRLSCIMITRGWAPKGTWLCVQAVEVGTVTRWPIRHGSAVWRQPTSCFHWGVPRPAQLHCQWRWVLGSVCEYPLQKVVVTTWWTPENDSRS